MSQIPFALLQPEYWQDFEKLTLDVCTFEFEGGFVHHYGRQGQDQHGVDIYVHDRKTNLSIGIQCKERKQQDSDGKMYAGGQLTKSMIEEEIGKAETFGTPLDWFIIATTALRDSKTQDLIFRINAKRRAKSSFEVHAWFWDDFQDRINRHMELLYIYYADVLKANKAYDQDKHILTLFHTAFSRAAFNTSATLEGSAKDFRQAIIDTQEAINTGRLRDREDQRLIKSVALGAAGLSKVRWRRRMNEINNILQKIRENMTSGVKDGRIRQSGKDYIDILDDALAEDLDNLRCDALMLLNKILKEVGLDQVNSLLLERRLAGRRRRSN